MRLDQAIIFKTEDDIIELFEKENEKLKPIFLDYCRNSLYYSIIPIRHPFAYPILRHKAIEDKEFINSFIKIKLNWYRRNLATLEILAEKQNLPDNTRLVFKIVRENLNQKHISEEINFYYWWKVYNRRLARLTKHSIREIFS